MPRLVAILFVVAVATSGCVLIEGVANTNMFKALPAAGTYAVETVNGDQVVGRKIARMVAYQMEAIGYTPAAQGSRPDIRVAVAFDVVPEGTVSDAPMILPGATRTTYLGNTAISTSGPATVIGGGGTRIFKKTIAINMRDGVSGEVLWDGNVSESGWCNQIFVTAPSILGLMFDKFPQELTNVRERIADGDPRAERFKRIFPPDTQWGCGHPG